MAESYQLPPGNDISVGIIVIGRNEGDRLRLALQSLPDAVNTARLYVDSGSTDGSVDLAISLGFPVHGLSTSRPFSAARARREGVDILLKSHPNLQFIQFLDGDCVLDPEWIQTAVAEMRRKRDLGAVCGMLSEAEPDASVYNHLNHLQWRLTPGDIKSCGGIFVARVTAYQLAGGFNHELLTGEEEDLCSRIRQHGYHICRIPSPMAIHDSGLIHFRQWWTRAVWGGYGDALKLAKAGSGMRAAQLRHMWSRLLWPFVVPLVLMFSACGAFVSRWMLVVSLSCVIAYSLLFVRILVSRFRCGDSWSDASIYAFFCILRKAPVAVGFVSYFLQPVFAVSRPDPHAADAEGDRSVLQTAEAIVPSDQLPMVGR